MNAKSRNIDICSGNLFKNILLFLVPLMLSEILQLLYNAADVVVVGRFAGQEALAGVGTSGTLMNVAIKLFVGLSVGASVAMGRAVGEKNDEKIHRVVHTAIAISLIAGTILTLFGASYARTILLMMNVPENVLPQALLYTRIMFYGTVPSMLYNFGSGLLRAMGDTRRPFYVITVSGIINVILNLIFVLKFKMKADGVALATIISQAFSATMIITLLMRQKDSSRLILNKIRIYKEQLKLIVKVGVPTGLQSTIVGLSNLIIQSSINSFGATVIAGNSAASNIDGFMYAVMSSLFHASMTFISQNIGAKKYERINKIMNCCIVYTLMFGVVLASVSFVFGKSLLKMYIPNDPVAIGYGYTRLCIVGTTYFLCGFMEIGSGAMRGMGRAFISMIISVTSACGVRILWILTAFKAFPTLGTLYMCYPISWILAFSCLYILFRKELKKYLKASV